MNDIEKARRKARQLIETARAYRKRYGMCENLGYNKHVYLDDFMASLDLSYREKCDVDHYYLKLCDELNKEN